MLVRAGALDLAERCVGGHELGAGHHAGQQGRHSLAVLAAAGINGNERAGLEGYRAEGCNVLLTSRWRALRDDRSDWMNHLGNAERAAASTGPNGAPERDAVDGAFDAIGEALANLPKSRALRTPTASSTRPGFEFATRGANERCYVECTRLLYDDGRQRVLLRMEHRIEEQERLRHVR